ncbi:hypothetical protein LH435_03175 [Laribacter hongkongensis]|nr:KilA-N domain-containing protein [Laribacter hongkongensis]MCG8994570.1 hypothetical protein [Laribacter hongkongensis]MCG9009223.1 hypothetical protein [Laribacter hongkongensis]MCG9021838.1 hypothetical protein [Laribacter hongkongensis]MCG9045567.1 hypothetical protein [Laribacter hongkongensis]MCG9073028.1 hypothetical protein [Laribacter hongkongensis]
MGNVIQIERIEIKQDTQGRHCLNDLHKAAGGEPKHRANYFLDREEARDLIAVLEEESAGIPAVSKVMGRNGGT